ncbi:MAG TPA: hypothetical protein VFN05_18470 [Actinomycetes bacterium]|nr:hypothetical protein [Actinomycetes bacterium]
MIVGLSGLVAMHIFMLAGHGHGNDPFAGMRGVAAHSSTATPPSVTTATDGDEDEDGAGMHLEMTVACLAVVAGLLLLQPKQRRQTAPSLVDERGPTRYPARADLACDHLRSSASR